MHLGSHSDLGRYGDRTRTPVAAVPLMEILNTLMKNGFRPNYTKLSVKEICRRSRPLTPGSNWVRFSHRDVTRFNRRSLVSGMSLLCCCGPLSQSAHGSRLKQPPSGTSVQSARSSLQTPSCPFTAAVVRDPAGRWLEPVAPQFRVVQWTGELFHPLTFSLHPTLVRG